MDLPKFDRYVATGILGEGAMGTVYRGFDPRLKREVAIKTVRPEILRQNPELRARFEREAKAVAALHHPAIVQIHDFSGDYLVMELLRGEELKRLLRAGRVFSLAEIAFLVNQLADALDYAHAMGIIHRDLKPANLFIDPQGRPKITDFGVAKLQDETMAGLTAAGKVLGSPAYMSPEQVQGMPLDGRSDQFSLGVVVYQLLTGHSPFAADSLTAVIHKIINVPPPPLQSLNPDAPVSLEPVLQKVLAKWREERYPDCRAFAAAFAQAAGIDWDPRLTTPPDSRLLPAFMASAGENTATAVPIALGGAPAAAPGNTRPIDSQLAQAAPAADLPAIPKPRSWKFSAVGLAVVILGLGFLYFVRREGPAGPDPATGVSPPAAPVNGAQPSTAEPALPASTGAGIILPQSSAAGISTAPPAGVASGPLAVSTPDPSALPASAPAIQAPRSAAASDAAPPPIAGESSARQPPSGELPAPQSPADPVAAPRSSTTASGATSPSAPAFVGPPAPPLTAPAKTPPAKSAAKSTRKPASIPAPKSTPKASPKPAARSAPKPPAKTSGKSSASKLKKPITRAKSWIDRHLIPKKDS